MPNLGDDTPHPPKAPIDQWLSGELSTTEIIDRILGFFGIDMKSTDKRDKEDDGT